MRELSTVKHTLETGQGLRRSSAAPVEGAAKEVARRELRGQDIRIAERWVVEYACKGLVTAHAPGGMLAAA